MSAAFIALAVIAQAVATSPPLLGPTGKWTVDYAENMCTVARSYGSPEKPLILGFKPSPMSEALQLVVISSGSGQPTYVRAQIAVNDAAAIEGRALAFTTAKASTRVFVVDMARSDLVPLAKSGKLAIKIGWSTKFNLEVQRFDLALKGLDACERNLLKHWGMSEELQASIVAKPMPLRNLGSYLSDKDYPKAAIRAEQQGASGVRFMVGVDGTPRDCNVVEPSGSALLDQATCNILLTRPKFSPALDRAGKPAEPLLHQDTVGSSVGLAVLRQIDVEPLLAVNARLHPGSGIG